MTGRIALPSLPAPPALSLFTLLSTTLSLLVPLGLLGAYLVGAKEISIAEERSNFVSAVTHELKTPLTAIRMHAEILLSGWTADENKRRSYYSLILEESERLSRLIQNVLFYASLTHGNENSTEPMVTSALSPSALLNRAIERMEPAANLKGFTLIAEGAEGEVDVLANEDLFIQVMMNLIDNALKFSADAERREVVLNIRRSGAAFVDFSVRDFGRGLPTNTNSDDNEKYFTVFYRGESELTRSTTGIGMGLALVKELVSKMNGTVRLERRNAGVEAVVSLLAAPSDAPPAIT